MMYAINPREAKYDPRTIADAARIFHMAGENWTMPSEGWDMTNFGLFSGDDDLGGAVARRVYEKAIELRVGKYGLFVTDGERILVFVKTTAEASLWDARSFEG